MRHINLINGSMLPEIAPKAPTVTESFETEKIAKAYERSPGAAPFYKDTDQAIAAPIGFVPTEMVDVHVKEVCGGELYCLTFRKTAATAA
jgi:hypothetical protein